MADQIGRPEDSNSVAERALGAIRQRYVLIGKRAIRGWRAWLVLGLAVGAVAGVLLVANRSGEFGFSLAAGSNAITLSADPENPESGAAVGLTVSASRAERITVSLRCPGQIAIPEDNCQSWSWDIAGASSTEAVQTRAVTFENTVRVPMHVLVLARAYGPNNRLLGTKTLSIRVNGIGIDSFTAPNEAVSGSKVDIGFAVTSAPKLFLEFQCPRGVTAESPWGDACNTRQEIPFGIFQTIYGVVFRAAYPTAVVVRLTAYRATGGLIETQIHSIRVKPPERTSAPGNSSTATVASLPLPANRLYDGSQAVLSRFSVSASGGANGVSLYKTTFLVAIAGDDPIPNDVTISNLRLYAYSNANFTGGAYSASGQLNNRITAKDEGGGRYAMYFDPQNPMSTNPEAIAIPPGTAYYFELRGDVFGADAGDSATISMLGDGTSSGISSAPAIDASADNNFIWSANAVNVLSGQEAASREEWQNGVSVSGLSAQGNSTTLSM